MRAPRRTMQTLAAVAGVWLGCAHANDSSAELDNNGLRLTHDPDIAMLSEDLTISTKAVHVEYLFENHGAAAKTVTIAFPMPDVTGGIDSNVGLPGEDPVDPFQFRVSADGVPVHAKLMAGAFVGDAEITKKLAGAGIALMPFANGVNEALDKLPQATRDAFVAAKIAAIDEYSNNATGPMEKHLVPTWTWRAAYVWTQSFPAGRPVRLVQDYAPSVGGTSGTAIGGKGWRTADYMRDYPAKYCIDQSFESAVDRAMVAKKAEYAPFTEERINYVLKTGANWAGPIGAFRLVVDKGEPDNLVSFCGDGVAKVGATKFEMRKTDFTPKEDLHILILVPIHF
jgi:Domain of unknown function (DUF4424)